MTADLHIHTYYSDGSQSPEDVVRAAKARGVGLISVTDHDGMLGSARVAKLAKDAGICAVDGIEISAYSGTKIHILGYGLDSDCGLFKSFFERCVKGAEVRTRDIVEKLNAHGIKIKLEEILREKKFKEAPLHVTHVSSACTRKGYARSPYEFYLKYLNAGKCAYSDLCRPTPEEAIEVIAGCGGFSSLAHPGRIAMDKSGLKDLVKRLKNTGLCGIEAVYSGHTDSDTEYYKQMAESEGLLVTGGSDTHHAEGGRCIGVPRFVPGEGLLAALKIKRDND